MPQQRFASKAERTRECIAPTASRAVPAASSQGNLSTSILQLQQILGNRRVTQLTRARRLTPQGRIIGLQPKLTVSVADDQYQQKADGVARQVMTMPMLDTRSNSMQRAAAPEETLEEKTTKEYQDKIIQAQPLTASITSLAQRKVEEEEPLEANSSEMGAARVQRQTLPEEEKAKADQASPVGSLADSFEAGAEVGSRLNRSKGDGSPLPDAVRTLMEPRFGMDFSLVRAHTGQQHDRDEPVCGHKAFTHGTDIYYCADSSPDNLELPAHELTHVVQQTGGAPLQPKMRTGTRVVETAPASASPAVQRVCSSCSADTKKQRTPSGTLTGGRRPPNMTCPGKIRWYRATQPRRKETNMRSS